MTTTNKLTVHMRQRLGAKLHKRTSLSKGCVARVCEWSKWGGHVCASQGTRAATERRTQDANARMVSGGDEQTSACFFGARELLSSLMARLSEQRVGHTLGGSTTRLQGVLAKVKRGTHLGPDCAPTDT